MASLVLLDTSALLEQPQRCYACFLSRMEVLYRVWEDEDERAGRLAYEQLKAPPLADAWMAAAVQQVGATLLHNDPELRTIAELSQEWLR